MQLQIPDESLQRCWTTLRVRSSVVTSDLAGIVVQHLCRLYQEQPLCDRPSKHVRSNCANTLVYTAQHSSINLSTPGLAMPAVICCWSWYEATSHANVKTGLKQVCKQVYATICVDEQRAQYLPLWSPMQPSSRLCLLQGTLRPCRCSHWSCLVAVPSAVAQNLQHFMQPWNTAWHGLPRYTHEAGRL